MSTIHVFTFKAALARRLWKLGVAQPRGELDARQVQLRDIAEDQGLQDGELAKTICSKDFEARGRHIAAETMVPVDGQVDVHVEVE